MSPPRPRFLRFGIVPLAVAAAMLLRLPSGPSLGSEFPFLFLWPVVIFSAWYGGAGRGLLATALSSAAAFFLLEPRGSPRSGDLIGLAAFALVGGATSLLAEGMHRARRRADQHREWLHAET